MLKKYRKNLLLILAAAVVLPLILALSFLLAPASEPEVAEAAAVTPTIYWGYEDGEEPTLYISNKSSDVSGLYANGSFSGDTRFTETNLPPWKAKNDSIYNVGVKGIVCPKYMDYWFYKMDQIWNFSFYEDSRNYLDTSETLSMKYTFSYLGSNMSEISSSIGYFNTRKVQDMSHMFEESSIDSISLSWDTSNVTSMYCMFAYCGDLEEVELGFNTSKVSNMQNMFMGCRNLYCVDISSFDMSRMGYDHNNDSGVNSFFDDCRSINTMILPPMSSYLLSSELWIYEDDWYDSDGNSVSITDGSMTGGGAFYIDDGDISEDVKVQIGSTVKYFPSLPSAFNYANRTAGDATVTVYRDITSGITASFNSAKKLTLDLNGYVVRLSGSDGSVIEVVNDGADFTLKDSNPNKANYVSGKTINGGVITGGITLIKSHTAGGISVPYGKFTMDGGTIYKNTGYTGGGVHFMDSTFTMNNGAIIDNTSLNSGGGIQAGDGTKIDLKKGTISGNKANHGGGIYISSSGCVLTIGTVNGNNNDVIISNNTARTVLNGNTYGDGGGIDLEEGNTLILNKGIIENNTASFRGGAVYVYDCSKAEINFKGGIIRNNEAKYGGGIYVDDGGATISGDVLITENTAEYGGGIGNYDDQDEDRGANIDMNGGTIHKNVATLRGGGIALICNTSSLTLSGGVISENKAELDGDNSKEYFGGGVYFAGVTFTMTDGTIKGNRVGIASTARGSCGGGVYVKSGSFTMTGGTIGGNNEADANTAELGGGVYFAGATFNMQKNTSNGTTGTISGNRTIVSKTRVYGAGVYVDDGNFTLSDGVISGNVAISSNEGTSYVNGGGVCVDSGSTFNMNGGMISGNVAKAQTGTAYSNGGGVHVDGGTFNLNGGEITGNDATSTGGGTKYSYGGGVCVDSGTVNMYAGTINNNTAIPTTGGSRYGYGGGVYVGGGTVNMYAGMIELNEALVAGGGVCVNFGKFTMFGGTISENTGTGSAWHSGGGGVCVNGGSFLMKKDENTGSVGTIQNNQALSTGGGVCVWIGTFTLSAGVISGNKLKSEKNSNVYLDGSIKITIDEQIAQGTQVYLSHSSSNASKVFTSGYTGSGNDAEKYSEYFFADTGECLWLDDGEVAVGHNATEHPRVEATCDEDGNVRYWSCSLCGKNFSDAACTTVINDVVLEGGHIMQDVAAVAAKCGEAGNIAYMKCTRCDKYFVYGTETEIADKSSVVIAALEHVWVEQSDTATCTSGGMKTYNCTNAGCSVGTKTESSAALGHDVKHVNATAATCVSTGIAEHWYCDRDGCSIKGAAYGDSGLTTGIDKVVPAKGHTYEKTGYNGQPSWAWTGYTSATATFTCTECAANVNGHTHDETATTITPATTPATCVTDGKTIYTASLTYKGKTYQTSGTDNAEEVLTKTGHTWEAYWGNWTSDGDGGWTIQVQIKCKNSGCEEIGKSLGAPDEINHSRTLQPTCIAVGKETYTAKITYLGNEFNATPYVDDVAMIAHSYADDYTTDINPTCTTKGSESRHCTTTDCVAKIDDREIAALGHDWEVEVEDGTAKQPYAVFDTFSLDGYKVTFTCNNDHSHTVTFTDGENATIEYADGNCLHMGDTSVAVTTTLTTYDNASDTYTIEGITVDKREAENVVWEYSSNGTNWTTLDNDAEFTYDTKTYTVRVKFDAYSGDDKKTADNYAVTVGTFKDYKQYGYKFELAEQDNYTVEDGVRRLTVNKAQITVGGEKWVCNGDELMSGFVKEVDSEYKYSPVATEGATEVTNAVVRFVDEEVTISYNQPAEHKNIYSVGYMDVKTCTASQSGKYIVTALFTLKNHSYEFVAAEGATYNSGNGTVTLTKEWYAAVCNNGFNGGISGWTFGSTASALPTLEKDDNQDATVSLVLKRNGELIGEFNRGNYSHYVNSTMPVGNYTLEATVGDVTIDGVEYTGFTKTLTFTVSKAAFTVSNLSDLADIATTYDGNLHIHQDFTPTVTLITAGEGVWVNYASLYGGAAITYSHSEWSDYFTVAQIEAMTGNKLFINAADNAYEALYKISALNYEDISGSFDVEISKATYDMSGVMFPDGDEDLEYDGNPHSIYISGTLPNGVTVSYDGNGKTNAKADGYLVTAKFTGDSVNYEAIENMTATLYINKATYDMSGVTFPDGAFDLEYDGNPHSIFISGKLPNGVTVEYDGNGKTNAKAEGYAVTAKFTGDSENYEPIENMTATLYINKAKISLNLSFPSESLKYNGTQQKIELVGTLPEQVRVDYNNDSNIAINIGEYNATANVYIKAAYVDNYEFAAGTTTEYNATLTITLGEIDMSGVTFPDGGDNVVYNGKPHSLSIVGTLPVGVTYSYENNEWVTAGEHEVIVHFYHNFSNYGPISDKTAKLVIKKADYDMSGVTFPDATVAYTGNAHSLSIRGILPAGVTYEYENNSLTNVGSQLVTVKFTGDSENYNPIDDKKATLRVVPASFGLKGISLEGATVNYDGNTHSLTVNGTLPEGVTVKYYVNIDGEEVEFNGATDANTYDVIAKFIVVDSVNYKAPHPLTAKLTIVAPEKTERPTEIIEPTVTEISPTASGSVQVTDKTANAVLAEVTEKSEFPGWIIAVCFIAVEAAVMLGIGCYIAFGAYKRKKS